MIEQGFVQLIQSGISALSPTVPGGYAASLPKDLIGSGPNQVQWAWVYKSVVAPPTYTLAGQDGLTGWEVQVDCHGVTMANAIMLARAIDGVLRGGYSGTLTDPDNTVVQGIFRQPRFVDDFSDTDRTFVRSLEYLVNYQQQ